MDTLPTIERPPVAPAPPTRSRIVVALAGAALAGAAIGVGTQVLQGILPGAWNVLANSGVMWALGAVLVGLMVPSDRVAAVAGAVAMVAASYSYSLAVEQFEHIASNGSGAAMWARAGLLAGPFFASAGRSLRSGGGRRWIAVAAIGGAVVGEGVHLVWLVGVGDLRLAGVVELVAGAGLLAPALLRHTNRLAVVAVATACTAITLAVLDVIPLR